MVDTFVLVLLLAGCVGAGLIGGLFFTFSTFVMQAFDRLPPAQAIAAMQAINVTVLNPAFFIAFFGTALIAVVLAVLAVVTSSDTRAVLILIGAAAYLFGSILMTIVFNVPLNNRLARVQGERVDRPDLWPEYRGPWTRWNHVRTVASLIAAAAFGIALAQ